MQGTATGDIAAGDLHSDLTSSVPVLILSTTADGLDPRCDLASNIPALRLPTRDDPALSDPTPDDFPLSPYDNFLHLSCCLESSDRSLQIQHLPSLFAASESSLDVVVPATLQSQNDPALSAPPSFPV